MNRFSFAIVVLLSLLSCSKEANFTSDITKGLEKDNFDNKLADLSLKTEKGLITFKNSLKQDGMSLVSNESINLLHMSLGIKDFSKTAKIGNQKTNDFLITDKQREHIKNLALLLSNSNNSEEVYQILEEDKKRILNSDYTVNELIFLMDFNNSVRISTEFLERELVSHYGITARRSWWGCLKKAYADLTDDFVGLMAVAVNPGPCCAAIVVGGTINYLIQ
ncbi:hypothetical protein ACILE2_00215 [Capnocytophaga canimorsus]|uniref:hypothetical protein n=1 Tax=Capnocytophaga canimorsus TaxID=28188 RepID=UPI0037D1311E